MEEALEILWTYARREPLDSNGETIVPTINNSIAAIRIIMRLEGWAMESEKRKVNSEKRATHNKPARGCRGEWQFAQSQNAQSQFAQPQYAQPQYAQSQYAQSQYAQSQNTQHNTNNNTNNHNGNELSNKGELPFAPTPAQHQITQHQYPQPNISHNSYHTAGASLQLVPQENLLSFTRHTLPSFAPAPFHIAYYEVLTRFAMGEIKKLMITMPPQHGKSEGATRRLPAFVLGLDPDKRIAIVSYNAIKARKFNRELQRIMDDDR